MAKVIIKKRLDTNTYEYNVINKEDNTCYIKKSGFTTPEQALEAAKKDYKTYIINNKKSHYTINTKYIKEKIKNLRITALGYKLTEVTVFSAIVLTSVFGGAKIIKEWKDKFAPRTDNQIENDENSVEVITVRDCDFSNIHIIIRNAKTGTTGVANATSDMLTRLEISNEIVNKDSNIANKVSEAISNNPNSNIIILNLETGVENSNNNKTIIMGDSSNNRKYSSDILGACIKASLNDYNLNPIIKSGKSAGIWRNATSIETELTSNGLINNVSQLTIDLPKTIKDDEIIKNDAAASIIEGIMRWTSLSQNERYANIYYTTQYSDTLITISQDHNISIKQIEENSDINMNKGVRVGNTVLIDTIPKVATDKAIVYNPYITTDHNMVEPIIHEHIVQSGETVSKIANMYGVRIEDIVVPSGNINNIYVGDTLYITTPNLYETHKKVGIEKQKTNIKKI